MAQLARYEDGYAVRKKSYCKQNIVEFTSGVRKRLKAIVLILDGEFPSNLTIEANI